MGTFEEREGADSDVPAFPEERVTDAGAVPTYWPARKTQEVIAEAGAGGLGWDDQGTPLWERWFERALEAGVDEDLAALGRSLIREAKLLHWDRDRVADCGWIDDGEEMLERALSAPEFARRRWQALLDGEP